MVREKRLSAASGMTWLYLTVLLLGILTLLFGTGARDILLPFSGQELTDISTGWKTSDGRVASLTGLTKYLDGNGTVTLQNNLPVQMAHNANLNFRSKNICFLISIGGKPRYDFNPPISGLAGRSSGTTFHSIPLTAVDAGQKITIQLRPVYRDNSGFVNEVMVGPSGAYYQVFLQTHLIPFLICVIIQFTGAGMIVLYCVTLHHAAETVRMDMFSLGILAIMLGGWSATETLVPQLLIGNAVAIHGLNYLLLILMPYPASCFVNSILTEPKKWYPRLMFCTVMLVLAAAALLNRFSISDFHETLPLIHAVLLATVLSFVVLLYRDRRHKGSLLGSGRRVLPAFAVMILFTMADLGRYVFSDRGSSDAGFFMRAGMLLFFLVLFGESISSINRYMRLAGEADANRHMAFTDVLTGLANRAAYLEKKKKIMQERQTGSRQSIAVCQFDINDLKYVNDNFGHAAGDSYIRAAAEAIQSSFGADGFCARIGGDEFTVLLEGNAARETFEKDLAALRLQEKQYGTDTQTGVALHIACGYAPCLPGMRLEDAERAADRDMYDTKQEMKGVRPQENIE